MEKIIKVLGLVATLVVGVVMASCSADPKATDLEFSYKSFSYDEGSDGGYVSVYLMQSPYKYPVVVDMEVEMLSGKDNLGGTLNLDDVLTFNTTDKSYTITQTSPRTATIENVEVTYANYNQRVLFDCHDNDYLQNETITLEFRLTKVDGSEKGSITSTIVTIVDDEKAPRIRTGYYDTTYDAPADATRQQKGQFYLSLSKVGKYEYVASGWFGLNRPRLVGQYDPEAKTLTFDGTDYDHQLWELKEPVSAFQNDTIWAYNYEGGAITQVLRLRGAGAEGNDPIVLSTEEIAQDAQGLLLSIDNECGVEIRTFNASTSTAGAVVGIYDSMPKSKTLEFSETNYPSEAAATKASANTTTRPTPFHSWSIATK